MFESMFLSFQLCCILSAEGDDSMDGYTPPAITESGRIVMFATNPNSEARVLELIDGAWVKPSRPVSFDDDWNSRILSADELRTYTEKSGSAS